MTHRNDNRYLEQEFGRPDHLQQTASKNMEAVLDRRGAERVPLYSRVLYSTDQERGFPGTEGHLQNLSKTGCRIVGPVLEVGSTTSLCLYLEDGKPPLTLTGATVRWHDGQSFGVQFPPMRDEDRQRLQELVLKHATLHGTSQDHTAFRIADS